MDQDIDYEEAMRMINSQLREMKEEMDEVEEMNPKGEKKNLARYMKRIYKKLEEMVDVYAKTQEHGDFNNICRELEALQPAFVLNYNEIFYEQGLEQLNSTLDEMEEELEQVNDLKLSDPQERQVQKMHEIYDEIHEKVDQYAHSHDYQDFESAIHQVERLKPDFILNYNELTD